MSEVKDRRAGGIPLNLTPGDNETLSAGTHQHTVLSINVRHVFLVSLLVQ